MGLLVFLVVLGASGSLAGCVIPPSLEVASNDAGVNSPPAILAVRSDEQELAEPGPVLIVRNPGIMMSLTLFDTDLDDTLYVRMYVDYTVADPKPARSACTASLTASATRSAICDISALCQTEDVGAGITRFLNIAVFDRMLLDSGTPQFKAMEVGGHTTSKSYLLECRDPTQ